MGYDTGIDYRTTAKDCLGSWITGFLSRVSDFEESSEISDGEAE